LRQYADVASGLDVPDLDEWEPGGTSRRLVPSQEPTVALGVGAGDTTVGALEHPLRSSAQTPSPLLPVDSPLRLTIPKKPPALTTQVAFPHEKDVVNDLILWIPLQDKRQVDLIARFAGDSPGDTETAGCPLRVVVRSTIVAVLDGQDIDSTMGLDKAGEKISLTDVPFPIIRYRGALPPPLRFVITPHLQDGLDHLHTWMGRGERELMPIQVSCPALRLLVTILILQTYGPAIAGQGSPIGSVPVIPPNL
jgi:hypothetical protein